MPDEATHRSTPPPYGAATREVSMLDGLLVLVRHLRLIVVLTLVAVALGIVVALASPREYVAEAVLVREAGDETGRAGGLAALRGLGLNVGSADGGLTVEAYPEILTSHEVRAALLDESFRLASGEAITLETYVREFGGGPLDALRDLLGGDDEGAVAAVPGDSLVRAYTFDELEAMEEVRHMVGVDADAETGLMTVTVTARDPVLAASLAARLVEELRTRVQTILTQKSREDYEFIRSRAQEAEAVLRRARAALGTFDDRNRGLTSARLLAERDRLRQEVALAQQIHTEYETELQQAEIDVQRANPVLTVLDPPVVPLLPSRPRRKVIVFMALLLGLGLGVLSAFLAEGLHTEVAGAEGRRKRDAVREALRRAVRLRRRPTATPPGAPAPAEAAADGTNVAQTEP